MRKYLATASCAAVAIAVTAPAQAQEAAQPFNGFHVEAITGYDHVEDGDDGILYGIGAGYDFRIDDVVLGIEAEALESTAGECAGGTCVDAGRDLYIGGRIGGVVADSVLLYAKAGYTNARVVATTGNTTVGANLDGLRIGGGVEYRFSNSPLSLRAEYRYSNYEAGVDRHQGVLGLAYRF